MIGQSAPMVQTPHSANGKTKSNPQAAEPEVLADSGIRRKSLDLGACSAGSHMTAPTSRFGFLVPKTWSIIIQGDGKTVILRRWVFGRKWGAVCVCVYLCLCVCALYMYARICTVLIIDIHGLAPVQRMSPSSMRPLLAPLDCFWLLVTGL